MKLKDECRNIEAAIKKRRHSVMWKAPTIGKNGPLLRITAYSDGTLGYSAGTKHGFEINDQFELWWKENAKSGKHWENKEGFRNAFFEGRISGITKLKEYKKLKKALKGFTDCEFVVLWTEILNCLRVELDKRKTLTGRITTKCLNKKHYFIESKKTMERIRKKQNGGTE